MTDTPPDTEEERNEAGTAPAAAALRVMACPLLLVPTETQGPA